ncbi:MAG: hypothetical protein JOZ73_03780 [Solirubrobacterales bacterium]|nr:hypothetical protein [Solirubrobacterales bacterium]
MRKRLVGAIATAIMVSGLAAVPAAQAKVALGTYKCRSNFGNINMVPSNTGWFKLKRGGKYAGSHGFNGHGKYKVKGKRITFKGGPLSGFYGRARKASDGTHYIVLYVKSDQAIQEGCFHK